MAINPTSRARLSSMPFVEMIPAAAVRTVDTTGACDAFAAALAVYCMRGESLHTALELANCAAGLSTERQGVPPALPDDLTVRQFYQTHPFAAK